MKSSTLFNAQNKEVDNRRRGYLLQLIYIWRGIIITNWCREDYSSSRRRKDAGREKKGIIPFNFCRFYCGNVRFDPLCFLVEVIKNSNCLRGSSKIYIGRRGSAPPHLLILHIADEYFCLTNHGSKEREFIIPETSAFAE